MVLLLFEAFVATAPSICSPSGGLVLLPSLLLIWRVKDEGLLLSREMHLFVDQLVGQPLDGFKLPPLVPVLEISRIDLP